jgi:hypothetical protein
MVLVVREVVDDIFDLLMKQDDQQIVEMLVVIVHVVCQLNVHVLQLNMNVTYLGVLRIDQNEHFGLSLMVDSSLLVDLLDSCLMYMEVLNVKLEMNQ